MIEQSNIAALVYKSLKSMKASDDLTLLINNAINKAREASRLNASDFETNLVGEDSAYQNIAWIVNYLALSGGMLSNVDETTDRRINAAYAEAQAYFLNWRENAPAKKARISEINDLWN